MHLIITNKYKDILSGINPDNVNVLEGVFDIHTLTEKVKGFSYDKIVLDITAVEDFSNEEVLKQLTALSPSDIVLYLDNTKECVSKEFLEKLVDFGMYNFTRNADGIKYLLNNPNTIENVKNIIDSSTKKESVKEETKEVTQENNTPNLNEMNYANTDFVEEEVVEETPKVYDFSYKPEDNEEKVEETLENISTNENLEKEKDDEEEKTNIENKDLLETEETKEEPTFDIPMSNGFIETNFSDIKPVSQVEEPSVAHDNETFNPFPDPLTDIEPSVTNVEVSNLFGTEEKKEETGANEISTGVPRTDENSIKENKEEEGYESTIDLYKRKRIIGIKNITEHAGSTSLIYMFYKQLSKRYEVVVLEIDLLDLTLFRNPAFVTTSKNDVRRQIERYSAADYILIDLNDETDYSYCDEVLFLVEPSTIKMLKLRLKDKEIFTKLKDGKIILNKSLLTESDIKDFQYETKTKVFYNMPPINDRNENQKEIVNLMKKIGL